MSSLSSSYKTIDGMPTLTPTPVYSNILVGQPPVYVQCTGITELTEGTVFQQPGDNVYLRLKLDDSNTVLYPVVGQPMMGQPQQQQTVQTVSQQPCRQNPHTAQSLQGVTGQQFPQANLEVPKMDDSVVVTTADASTSAAPTLAHECAHCRVNFATDLDLRHHVEVAHTGLKPYHCQVCGKDFARKCDLLRHRSSVHKESKPFECSSCGKGFPQRWYLERHMIAVHKATLQQMPGMPTVFTIPQAPQATILTHEQLMQQVQQQQLIQTQQHQVLTQQQHNQQVIQQQGQLVLQQSQFMQKQKQGQQSQAQQQQQQVDPQQHIQTSQNQVTHIVQPQFSQAAAHYQQSLQFSAFSQVPTNSIGIAAAGGMRFAVPMSAASVSSACPGAAALPSATMMPTFFFQPASEDFVPSTAATHHQLQLGAAAASSTLTSSPSVGGSGEAPSVIPHVMQQQQHLQQVGQPLVLPPAQHMIQQGANMSIIPQAQASSPLRHTAPKPRKQFACDQCDKVYPRNQSLQAHIIQVHTDVRPYTCRICRKGFVRRWDFYRHLNAVHRDRTREALDSDKVQEYVTWMSSRAPANISWECLNAVREEFPSPIGSSTIVTPVVSTNANAFNPSGTPQDTSPPPRSSTSSAAASTTSDTSNPGVIVTMIKPANE